MKASEIRTVHQLLHTVNNALAVISCEVQYLQDQPCAGEAAREALQAIRAQAERAAALIARVPSEAGRLELPAERGAAWPIS